RQSGELAPPLSPSDQRQGRLRAHRPTGLPPEPSKPGRRQMQQVNLYDTTLRDGMGGQGMSLSAHEKLRIVRALDRLGVHFIEAGFPSSNPKEVELFELLADQPLENSTV